MEEVQTVDKPINGDNVQTFKLLMSKNIYLQNRDMNSFFARLIKLFRNSKTSCRTEKRLFRQAETRSRFYPGPRLRLSVNYTGGRGSVRGNRQGSHLAQQSPARRRQKWGNRMIFPTFASAWRIGRREPDFFDKLSASAKGTFCGGAYFNQARNSSRNSAIPSSGVKPPGVRGRFFSPGQRAEYALICSSVMVMRTSVSVRSVV